MRLAALLLAAMPLAAQIVPGDLRETVPLLGRTGLVRGGLVAGWDLRTVNLLRWSEALDNAVWIAFANSANASITRTANYGIAPDGTSTAARLQMATTESGINDYAYYFQNIPAQSGSVVMGWWVRSLSGNVSLGWVASGGTSFQVAVSEQWQFLSPTVTATGGTTAGLMIRPYYGTSTAVDILVWHPQLNRGPTAAPYVPTTDLQTASSLVPGASGLVRGATTGAGTDDPTPSAAGWVFDGVDDWAGAAIATGASGTVMVAVKQTTTTGNHPYIAGANVTYLLRGSGTTAQYYPNVLGTALTAESRVDTEWATWAASYSPAQLSRLSKNGSLIASGNPGALVADTSLYVGRYSSQYLSGTISFVLIYNRALNPREIAQNHRWLKAKMAEVGVTIP